MSDETTPTPSESSSDAASPMLPFEAHAKNKKTPVWLVAAMKAHERWPIGREMTSDEFDAVAKKVGSIPIGGR
jgi:hypothetical protein